MRTPTDKRIILTIYSHPTSDLKLRWKAHVVFEPGSTDSSSAAVDIADGLGEPIADGVLEFAGTRTPVAGGRGALGCADFVRGKHESAIWLYRKGRPPVPGALTFE